MKKNDVWVLPTSVEQVRTCGVPLAFKAIGYHTTLSGLSGNIYGLSCFFVNRANEAVFDMGLAQASIKEVFNFASKDPNRKYYMLPVGPKCPKPIFEKLLAGKPQNCILPASWTFQPTKNVVIEGTREAEREGRAADFVKYINDLCSNLKNPTALITEGYSECSSSIERLFKGRALTVPSDYNSLGADALRIRNYQMAFEATHGIVYNDESPGGRAFLSAANRCSLPVRCFAKSRAYTCVRND